MSKYNGYAQKLDIAFKQAKEEHEKALTDYNKAVAEEKAAQEIIKETYIGERDAKISRAHAAVLETKAALDETMRSSWGNYKQEQERLTKALTEEVKKDFILSPGAIDAQAVELLKSGFMSPEDMQALADNFKNNPTMLRYINGSAVKAVKDNEKNDELRRAYNVVAAQTKGTDEIILDNWNELVNAGRTYLGAQLDGTRTNSPELIAKLANHWEDANVQNAINNF